LHIVTNLVANTLDFYTLLLNIAYCYQLSRWYTSLFHATLDICVGTIQ